MNITTKPVFEVYDEGRQGRITIEITVDGQPAGSKVFASGPVEIIRRYFEGETDLNTFTAEMA